ncbi:hypothetical protein D1AOALGA4SA_11940 [Olavius algarvensis Delta 1 endosymbiont]|nr:hypothetical protein D1AOALGA4SA_11940 [Olavius algarvensis Delta 1 endosymbiont]
MDFDEIVQSEANEKAPKSAMAADWLKSGFYPPNSTTDKCPQPR